MNSDFDNYIEKTFDTVASGYDDPALAFFSDTAELLLKHLVLEGSESLLDVCTGTGMVSVRAAKLLSTGQVVGVDRSHGMLEQAERKALDAGLQNIVFRRMDMRALEIPDREIDIATCSFGLFFVEEMVAALKHMADKVRSGGRVGISTFALGAFEPCSSRFISLCQQFGLETSESAWHRIAAPELLEDLFAEADLPGVRIYPEPLKYSITPETWWDIVWNAGYRGYLAQFSESELKDFKERHLSELRLLCSEGSLELDVGVLIAIATKP